MPEKKILAPTSGKQYCPKCKKTMAVVNFYTMKDKSKSELCKACLTMHVNNWQEDTYLWLLEKFDVPYLPLEWQKIRDAAYQKDPYKMNGMSVFGKYLSKMKLNQFKDHNSWADTQYWADKLHEDEVNLQSANAKTEEDIENMRKAYENGEISEAQFKTYEAMTHVEEPVHHAEDPTLAPAQGNNPMYPVNDHPYAEVELPDIASELTDEDKIYLATKWGIYYTPQEWVWLERKYEDFITSFDIQGAARIDTLTMICKTSLKANNAIDSGDYDTYQKLMKVYDSAMKSAKFKCGLCNTFLARY